VNSFGAYSKYYEFLYEDKNYQLEAEYIHRLLNKYSPAKTQSIFEMGCGTGKLAECLAKMDYKVHGIDLSESMLEKALERSKKLPQFQCEMGDVRTFESQKQFDSVISIFHVMSYQNSNEDLLRAFLTANRHLKNGGLFIFDFWYGPAVFSEKPEKRNKKFENSEFLIERAATPEIFVNQNKVHVNYDIRIVSKGTDESQRIQETHKMRYLFLPELEFFLKQSGFKLLKTAEWLSDQEPSERSWGVVAVAQKESEL
jgi:SAM-dependent methyltransferase